MSNIRAHTLRTQKKIKLKIKTHKKPFKFSLKYIHLKSSQPSPITHPKIKFGILSLTYI